VLVEHPLCAGVSAAGTFSNVVKFFNEAGVQASAITVLREITKMREYLKVPRPHRGHHWRRGSTKAQIEEKGEVKLDIDSAEGTSRSRVIRSAF